ncbi:helix-turn-helix domain-containing protein [Legionella micdadei]|uniref:AraC-type DNA-binding protein n=1 Tax=Legionella micdadei TaxID=451 RepID=A0A098GI46_LEGMI|nr:AraC family transcriptional regulator [Legionella micdadei]ARG96939.1 AraC family transcriptional regulator [Legionella micdadei]KTD26648.1 AraC family transcriptional regulator [Legionella micdadei]NSL19454.1 helix-turn-helix transcriptional regulator [Legionella micdadei]CEG61655.1 Transcriptional regulator, AraC-family [Legionella micdadei]SCY48290.1 AraC-type DNA-binding protein [Legionella micdadei]
MIPNYGQLSLRSYETYHCSHSHDFAQLVLPIQGVLELKNGCQSGLVRDNTAAFIAPNSIHSFAASRKNQFLVVDLKAPNSILNENLMPAFPTLTTSAIKFLHFAQNYLLQKDSDGFSDYLIQNLLFKLVSQSLTPVLDPKVLKVTQWINNNFAAPINLEGLTHLCHLSTSQLQRRFKKMTGQTVAEYWRMKKLSQAQLLLSTETLSISSIAYQLGYENVSAFSRCFAHTFGQSPSQWREMMLNANNMRVEDKTLFHDS